MLFRDAKVEAHSLTQVVHGFDDPSNRIGMVDRAHCDASEVYRTARGTAHDVGCTNECDDCHRLVQFTWTIIGHLAGVVGTEAADDSCH